MCESHKEGTAEGEGGVTTEVEDMALQREKMREEQRRQREKVSSVLMCTEL